MVTFIHQRELNAALEEFPRYLEEHADQQELATLHRTWIPLLSTYITHDSVENAIDEWYAMIKCFSLWFHYIEKCALKTDRPLVIETFSFWKYPFVFAGWKQNSGSYEHWGNKALWLIDNPKADAFIGLALPNPGLQSAHIVHFFEMNEEFFLLLEEEFEESGFLSKQAFLNQFYLSCISLIGNNQ